MTVSKIIVSVFFLAITGCGAFDQAQLSSVSGHGQIESARKNRQFERSNTAISSAKLREYCKACHGIGSMRFIWTESDEDLWAYIFVNNAPNRNRLWAESIYEVLNWPSTRPPASFPVMDPPNGRDWMPKGSKRLSFADDTVDSTLVRQIILESLKTGLSR